MAEHSGINGRAAIMVKSKDAGKNLKGKRAMVRAPRAGEPILSGVTGTDATRCQAQMQHKTNQTFMGKNLEFTETFILKSDGTCRMQSNTTGGLRRDGTSTVKDSTVEFVQTKYGDTPLRE